MELLKEILSSLSKEQEIDLIKQILLSTSTVNNMPGITNGKFAENYVEYIKKRLSKKYYLSIQTTFEHFKNYFDVNMLIAHIGKKSAEDFIEHLRGRAPKGYEVYLRNIKVAFNKAIHWGYISSNPFADIKPVKRQRNERKFIKEHELKLILEHIRNDVIRDMVILSYNTGLRLSETVNLPWAAVKLDERVLQIGTEEFTTKSRKVRYVPIPENIFTLLSKYIGKVTPIKRKYVFTKQNGYLYSSDYVSKTFKKACREADISETYTFHGLRHGYASNLAQRGISLQIIKELLGHADLSTTQIYAKLDLQTLRNAVDKLNEVQVNE